MPIRIVVDEDKPSAAVEISLAKPLPHYNLEQLEHPTPRHVDAVLSSHGFQDLIGEARCVLTTLLDGSGLEIVQCTGAICPGDDEVYQPGLWIVIRDSNTKPSMKLSSAAQNQIATLVSELVRRLKV